MSRSEGLHLSCAGQMLGCLKELTDKLVTREPGTGECRRTAPRGGDIVSCVSTHPRVASENKIFIIGWVRGPSLWVSFSLSQPSSLPSGLVSIVAVVTMKRILCASTKADLTAVTDRCPDFPW